MIKHFSLNAWHNYGDSEFWLIRLRLDWCRYPPEGTRGWYALDVGLLGLCASLTYWPRGKVPDWVDLLGCVIEENPAWRTPRIGREHGEAGE